MLIRARGSSINSRKPARRGTRMSHAKRASFINRDAREFQIADWARIGNQARHRG